MEVFENLLLLLCLITYALGNIQSDDNGTFSKKDLIGSDLESITELANASPGFRKLTHCSLNLERQDCNVNLTAYTSPCPLLQVVEHVFTHVDLAKISGGFLNAELSLVSLQFEFDKKGSECSPEQGNVEVTSNSSGKHIRIIDRTFLPLKVVLLQAIWPLHINTLRAIDLEINGVFISDNLNGFSKIPTYEGVVIEMRKPKGLTIFEMKTTKSQAIQLRHLLKDFNLDADLVTNGLSLKTKSELSLKKLMFADSSLIGYVEPNTMFEVQLTGKHSGSLAFTNARQIFVTIQKYKLQTKPSVAVFGKFKIDEKLDIEIMKLANIPDIPSFTFMTYIKDYMLVIASEKLAVLNIKQGREVSNEYYCKDCRTRFMAGLNVVFNVPDVLHFLKSSKNSTKSEKKNLVTYPRTKYVPHNALKRDNIFVNQMNSRRSRLEYYMRNLKRSKITHSSTGRRTPRHRTKRSEDNIKDILIDTNTANFTANESLSEFDDSFAFDSSFNPFPRTIDSRKSTPTNTTLNTTISRVTSNTTHSTVSNSTNPAQPASRSRNITLYHNVTKTSGGNTNSTLNKTLISELVEGMNKSAFEPFDLNSFSFHDISSLTSERQELDLKVKVPMIPKKSTATSKLIIYCSILENDVNFMFPQPTSADFDDIIRFVSTNLEGKGECNPFNQTSTKFSLEDIIVSDELLQINLNTTETQELTPGVLTVNRYMGVTLSVPKTDGNFDYEHVAISGEGKQRVMDEEVPVKLTSQDKECLMIGSLHLPTIQNISSYFDAEWLPLDLIKVFPYVGKISVKTLNITTRLDKERIVRLAGETHRYGNMNFYLSAAIWNDITSKKKRMAVALTSRSVQLNTVLRLVYQKNIFAYSWLAFDEAAVIFSISGIKTTTFTEKLFQDASKDSGITFVGKLMRPTMCETLFTNDRFCQYFHAKLAGVTGIYIKGSITKDKLLLTGKSKTSVVISEEVIMLDPVVSVLYEDGKSEIYISGSVVVMMGGGRKFKMQGRISRHGSGFVVLQLAASTDHQVFNNSLVVFKPLLGIAQLSKREDFACVIELHPSHVAVGMDNNSLAVLKPSGRLIPSDPAKNYFHGLVKDLTVSQLLEAISLKDSIQKIPILKDAKFSEYTKVVYAESGKVENFNLVNEDILPGLTFYGQIKADGNYIKSTVNIDLNSVVKVTMDWPVLNMSKGMISIRKSKEDMSTGPILYMESTVSPKPSTSAFMKGYVSGIGMERENVLIHMDKRNEGLIYMFTMKGKIYNEVEMFLMYRGFENSNLGFKIKGHCSNLANLKFAARSHLRKVFNDFIVLYSKQKKENAKATRDIDSLIHELGSTIEMNVKGKLKDFIIQLENVEESIKEYQADIDIECIEKCRKPVEIQTLQELDVNDIELKNLRVQRIAPKWAMNVSCIASCEVQKGISHKKATERLTTARNLFPLYEKHKRYAQKLDGFIKVAGKIKETAAKAQNYFLTHSERAKKVIEQFMVESLKVKWFDVMEISIPEVDTITLKGNLPCFRMVIKFTLYRESKDIVQELCMNGEFLHNLGKLAFHTVFSKSEVVSLIQHFDKVKSFYARIRQRRDELVNVIRQSECDGDDDETDLLKFEEMSKRDEVFKPLVRQMTKKEDAYDKRFKRLVLTQIPQYSVHTYKTTLVMNQKSPWAVLKAKREKRTSLARKSRSVVNSTTPAGGDDCNTVNGIVGKYSHITNALVDIVEAYNNGRTAFAETRDELVDSLHALDSKITNEANNTYYTKGELKDMIYWSVRVWKGVEDWVQESTRQFEEHNRNAINQFTEQLNAVMSSDHTQTAAGLVQKLSRIGTTAMKRMSITHSIVKKMFPAQPDDMVQNVALGLSQFLTAKDMTLDEATSKIQALRTALHTLEASIPPCDTPSLAAPPPSSSPVLQMDAATIASDAGATSPVADSSANAIVTSNSGTITMGGAPQILTEPSPTNGITTYPSQMLTDGSVTASDSSRNSDTTTLSMNDL